MIKIKYFLFGLVLAVGFSVALAQEVQEPIIEPVYSRYSTTTDLTLEKEAEYTREDEKEERILRELRQINAHLKGIRYGN